MMVEDVLKLTKDGQCVELSKTEQEGLYEYLKKKFEKVKLEETSTEPLRLNSQGYLEWIEKVDSILAKNKSFTLSKPYSILYKTFKDLNLKA